MKKIFLVLAFLLIAFSAMAQDWVGLDYTVQVGYASSMFGGWTADTNLKNVTEWNYPPDYQKSFYTLLGFDIWLVNHFFVGASITVQIEPWQGTISNWNPTFTNYMFEAGAQWGIFKLGWMHECTHPQNTYQFAYRVTSLWGEGAYDKFYLQIHSSIGSVPK